MCASVWSSVITTTTFDLVAASSGAARGAVTDSTGPWRSATPAARPVARKRTKAIMPSPLSDRWLGGPGSCTGATIAVEEGGEMRLEGVEPPRPCGHGDLN